MFTHAGVNFQGIEIIGNNSGSQYLPLSCIIMKGRHDTKEIIRKAIYPHPCPLPSRERGLKNHPLP
jgi:hypothetical protein